MYYSVKTTLVAKILRVASYRKIYLARAMRKMNFAVLTAL